MRRLEPGVRLVWGARLAITSLILAAAAIGASPFVLGPFPEWPVPAGAVVGGTLLLALLATIAVPLLRYRYWRFALREEELLLERGIWKRVRTVVPLRRIQHLDVTQTAIERPLGLGTLVVHTAGTRSNAVDLPGLAIAEAEHLRDTIKRYVLEDTL